MNLKLKPVFFLALLASAFCASQIRAQTGDTNSTRQTVLFRNGDLLAGKLNSIAADKSVVWQRSDVFQPIQFSGANISEIRFAPGKDSISTVSNRCRLELRNGDSLEGKLIRLDAKTIALETTFAGEMVFPRNVVQSLEPLPPDREPIFVGPTGLEGWIMGKVNALAAGEAGEWKYANGAFYATHSSSIARDLKLPDAARIEFDVAWKGMLQSAIAIYTSHMQPINLANKDNEPDFGGFYSLQINSFVATLMPVKKNEPLKYLGQTPVPQFTQKNRAHIEIRASKKTSIVALFADGVLVKEWMDPDGFAGTGTGMRFVHQGGQGSIKLSNLRITEWDGKMDTKSTNVFVGKSDLANLANGDKVSGTLEVFRDDKVTFATSGTKLDIPFNRISEIQFAGEGNATPDELGANVRAFLHNGGRVTFRVERWNEQEVIGTSPNFGRATFAPQIFERVQLNSISTNKVAAVSGR